MILYTIRKKIKSESKILKLNNNWKRYTTTGTNRFNKQTYYEAENIVEKIVVVTVLPEYNVQENHKGFFSSPNQQYK